MHHMKMYGMLDNYHSGEVSVSPIPDPFTAAGA